MTRSGQAGLLVAVLSALGCGAGPLDDDEDPALRPAGPRVDSFTPTGRVEGTVSIRVVFSEDAPEDLVGRPRPLEEVALAQPRLSASATFEDRRTLVIAPTEPFAPATGYRVALRADVLGGTERLVGRRAFRFHTRAFGLEDVRGWRGRTGIELSLRFSHPVRPEEAEAALTVSAPDGTLLRARVDRDGPRGAATHDAVFRLPVQVDLPSGVQPASVGIRIDRGLAGAAGGAPLGKMIRREVALEPEAPVVDQVRPVQLGARWGVAIDLGSSVAPSRLVGAVRGAGPSVRMALSPDGPWILGAFSPETTASLQIGPPLLPAARPWVVELPALQPAIRILDPEPLLDLAPGARLEVEHHGVQSLVLSARAVGPELVGLIADGLVPARALPEAWSGRPLGPLIQAADRSGLTALDPSPLLDGLPPGLVLLEVRDEQRPWLRDVRYLNRRGLELIVKRRTGYLWARVGDLRGPVPGAKVEVLGGGGEVLATGRAGRQGDVQLRFTGGPGVLAVAQDEARYAVLPLQGPYALRGVDRPGLRAVLIPDRTVLAPGQTLELSVLLSDARERPVGGRLQARLRREQGPVVAEAPVSVQARGTGRGRIQIPRGAEPGRHQLILTDPQGAEVVKVSIEVRLRRAGGARVVVDADPEPLAFRVRAEGLGRPEAVHGLCHYRRLDRFAGLPAPETPAPRVDPVPLELGDGSERVARCPEPPRGGPRPWSVRLQAYTRDARGGEATRVHAPEESYAALALPERPPVTGEPLDARLVVVDGRGRPVEGSIEVEIRSLEPRSGARIRPGGRLVPELLSVAGDPRTLTLALVEGAAIVPFVPPRGGPWRLRVGDTISTIWVGGAPGTPRPLELVLHRTGTGVRAALPFAGRLLLAEEGLEVGATRSTLETSVVAELAIGRGGGALTGLLLGTEGRWSATRLPPVEAEPRRAPVTVSVDDRLEPGAPIKVSVSARGPAWSGVFRVLAVDASAAPTDEELRRWLDADAAPTPALDTLVTAAFDDPAEERASAASAWDPGVDDGPTRPGRAAVASAWLDLSSRGFGYTQLAWPAVAGRARIIALVRAGGRLGFGSVERVIGDGLGLDVVAPIAVRVGDRLSVPVLLDNGSTRAIEARVELQGDGFTGDGAAARAQIPASGSVEVRVPAIARASGALRIGAGAAVVEREVARITDERARWIGRGATASYRSPAVLPTPEQLGGSAALLVIGPLTLTRFAAALKGLLDRPPLDAEQAAATVLAARALPDLTRTLDGEAALQTAMAQLDRGLAHPDPWLRVFSAHAALESGGGLAAAARQVLAEVAASASAPSAAPYARLLLARLRQAVPASAGAAPNSRPDAVALAAAAEVLLGRAEPEILDSLPIGPFTGARVGRFSPTLVDAVTLFALESLPTSHPAAAALEAAIIEAARASRWTHPAEEALALLALAVRARRVARRAYWGTVTLDGERVTRFSSKQPVVVSLDARLGSRPEVTVTGAGSAEVGLVLASAETGPPAAPGPLSVSVRRLDEVGEILDRPVLEGRAIGLEIRVDNAGSTAEEVWLDVPIPAGLSIEAAPAGASTRVGGYTVVTRVPAEGHWQGRFEARARHAGVWGAPPVTVRLRHGLAAATATRDELRIDAE